MGESAKAHPLGKNRGWQSFGLLKSKARSCYVEILILKESGYEVLDKFCYGRADLQSDSWVFQQNAILLNPTTASDETRKSEELEAASVGTEALIVQL